jgi:hypothetical protein
LGNVGIAGHRAPAGPGNVGTVAPGTSGKYGWLPITFLPAMMVVANSTAGSAGPQLLYRAIGTANFRAYVQGQDDRGGAALSNEPKSPRRWGYFLLETWTALYSLDSRRDDVRSEDADPR